LGVDDATQRASILRRIHAPTSPLVVDTNNSDNVGDHAELMRVMTLAAEQCSDTAELLRRLTVARATQ
jgi:hypothetical protein